MISKLLNSEQRDEFLGDLDTEYQRVVEAHERAEVERNRLPIEQARANAGSFVFDALHVVAPTFTGCRVLDYIALADIAEYTHARVRRELWGYAPDEAFTPAELIAEPYRGIRPAPGYPAQPDHSEKTTLFELLDAPRSIGVGLTESYSMWPGSSVSGMYFAHPDARYFAVGRIQRDQVESYAARKGLTVDATERLLGSILAYQP